MATNMDSALKIDHTLKSRKEEFVSNLSGGDLSEINLVIGVATASIMLWSALQSRQSFFTPYGPLPMLADLLLHVAAPLFAMTLYSSALPLLLALLVAPACLLSVTSRPEPAKKPSKPPQAKQSSHSQSTLQSLPIQPFLTMYRGSLLIVTCLAILAVDFRVFPRRFAKVETWGTSLMDLGVGSFVFSAGVVSARSVLKQQIASTSNLVPQASKSLPARLFASLRHSAPLFTLGLLRLYSVKNLDYAEHVTEYGVHWNFFFTLSLLPPFVELLHPLALLFPTSFPSYETLSLLLAFTYQILLDSTSLTAYILISPRGPSLLSKNREGIFSFVGYLSIYLFGRGIGIAILSPPLPSPQTRKKSSLPRPSLSLLLRALTITALFLLTNLPRFASVPVSRRLANLPYILWVLAFNSAQLTVLCLIENLFFPRIQSQPSGTNSTIENNRTKDGEAFATSTLMKAFNNNGLAIFLVANLLTGAVNLSMNTLDASRGVAMGVLMAYATVVAGVAAGMERMGWKVKI
ncbi:MAG: hypothetical protein Q9227_000309 [Pyrenula ochraceoflavens]